MRADKRELDQLLDCIVILKDEPDNESLRKLSQHRYEELVRDLNKLSQLEDIEEELGIDLITLFKTLTSDVFLYHNGTLTKCEQPPLLLCFDGEYCLEYHFEFDVEQVYLKDYGKIWALTKEELL